MGFRLHIQADYGSEILSNIHPDGKGSGGKAVFAFLGGLQLLHDWNDGEEHEFPDLQSVVDWYRALEKSAGMTFFPTCQPVIDCMWGDGGDPTEYKEDEFEFYRKRSPAMANLPEEDFREIVRASGERWRPIVEVAKGVDMLLDIFNRAKVEPLDGFYEAADTIPDFEALAANLDFLIGRGSQVVRLNFN